MTELRQNHHFHPLHEDEVREEVKPWRLPFWTEPPAWLAEKEKEEKGRHDEAADDGDNAEQLMLPTAEELENIRREAYNDGLEQGLVEGRQQGRKEGYDEGHQEGYQAAYSKGEAEGRSEGFKAGEDDGRRKGQADINATVKRLLRVISSLQASLSERDRQLPDVLSALVTAVCERVLAMELKDGAINIHQYVQRALDELPSGEKNARVYVGPDDARHLHNSLDENGGEVNFSVDDSLPAGRCRVETEHSLVEYSTAEHLNQLLDRVIPQLRHQAASFPDDREQQAWDMVEDIPDSALSGTSEEQLTDTAAEPPVAAGVAESESPATPAPATDVQPDEKAAATLSEALPDTAAPAFSVPSPQETSADQAQADGEPEDEPE